MVLPTRRGWGWKRVFLPFSCTFLLSSVSSLFFSLSWRWRSSTGTEESFKRIFLGYRIRSRSPRRKNKSKTPRWPPPLDGYAHEVVMGWRDWRLRRPWPTVTAWARSRSCWRYFWNRSTCRRYAWTVLRSGKVVAICRLRSPIAPDCPSPPRRAHTAAGIVRAARIGICWHPEPGAAIRTNVYFYTNDAVILSTSL